MPSPVRLRLSLAALPLALAALFLLAGCGGSKSTKPVVTGPRLPVGTPAANAPDSAAYRFMAAYTAGVEGEADTLLSADFCYHFSGLTDPPLASFYGNQWGKANEVSSLHHLLHGFTNGGGVYVPPASAMVFAFINPQVYDDAAHSDSSAYFKMVTISVLNLNVDVNAGDGPTTYNISAPFRFYMVRGDAAVLGAGQSPSPARWYLRDIDDLSAPTGASRIAQRFDDPTPARTTTWGSLRAQYL